MNAPRSILDADVLALLDAGVKAPARGAGAELKSRLLRRVAGQQWPQHLTLTAEQGAWRDLGGGLSLKPLHRDGQTLSYLVRMAPGAQLPPHRHPLDEECVVLEGEVLIGGAALGAGGFHLGRRDVLHDAILSPGGALLYLRGALPEVDTLL